MLKSNMHAALLGVANRHGQQSHMICGVHGPCLVPGCKRSQSPFPTFSQHLYSLAMMPGPRELVICVWMMTNTATNDRTDEREIKMI